VYIIENKIIIVSYYEKEIKKLRSDTDNRTLYFQFILYTIMKINF